MASTITPLPISFKETLLRHQRSCRGTKRCYTCSKCSRTFLSYSRYKTHVMASHTKERPFICPECGKGFVRKYALNTHVKNIHTKEKKFQCEVGDIHACILSFLACILTPFFSAPLSSAYNFVFSPFCTFCIGLWKNVQTKRPPEDSFIHSRKGKAV